MFPWWNKDNISIAEALKCEKQNLFLTQQFATLPC